MNTNVKHLPAGAVCMACGTIFPQQSYLQQHAWYDPRGRYFSAIQRNRLTLPFTLSLALALLGFIMLLWV